MGCVDTTKEDTSDGNLQAVVFYNSFALYFKLNVFFTVKADLKMCILKSVESMSQLRILHSIWTDIKQL